jgi:hypothetical protein
VSGDLDPLQEQGFAGVVLYREEYLAAPVQALLEQALGAPTFSSETVLTWDLRAVGSRDSGRRCPLPDLPPEVQQLVDEHGQNRIGRQTPG